MNYRYINTKLNNINEIKIQRELIQDKKDKERGKQISTFILVLIFLIIMYFL